MEIADHLLGKDSMQVGTEVERPLLARMYSGEELDKTYT